VAVIRNLMVKVGADISDMQKKMNTAQATISNTASFIKKAFIGGAIATGIKTIGQGIFNMAQETGAYADEIINLSKKTGLSTDKLQELRYATKQLDVDFASVGLATKAFTVKLREAVKPTSETARAFKALGVNILDSKHKVRPINELFTESIRNLSELKDETDRNLVASMLFGKQFDALIPIFEAGQGEIDRLSEKANRLGLVMSGEGLDAAAKYTDAYDEMTDRIAATKREIAMQFIPVIKNDLIPALESITPVAVKATEGIVSIFKATFTQLESWMDVLENWVPIKGKNKGTGSKFGLGNIKTLGEKLFDEALKRDPALNKILDKAKNFDPNKIEKKPETQKNRTLKTNLQDVLSSSDKAAKGIEKTKTAVSQFVTEYDRMRQAFRDAYGMFDKLQKQATISGSQLLRNLTNQAKAMKQWQESRQKIQANSNISSALKNELTSMGPESGSQLAKLLKTTDSATWKKISEQFGLKGQYATQAAQSQMGGQLGAKATQIIFQITGNNITNDRDIEMLTDKITSKLKIAGVPI
jgi:hypothetical protein